MKKSKLKRRLRKKLHVGEFQELGFEVSVKFKSNFTETKFDKFTDEFIDEIEGNKLFFGGGGNNKTWTGFVTSQEKYNSPTDEQREKIKYRLENCPEIAESEVGNFIDAWYDDKWKD